jgi:hypothetical protein
MLGRVLRLSVNVGSLAAVLLLANCGGGGTATPDSPGSPALTTAPATPAGLAVDSATASSLVIHWSASAGATSYQLFWDSDPAGTFATRVYSGADTTFTDQSLAASAVYYYKVQAVNTAGSSALSGAASGATAAATVRDPNPDSGSRASHQKATVATSASVTAGDKLVIGRHDSGATLFGLIGIYILENKKPSYTDLNCDDQIAQAFDFSTFDANYWKVSGHGGSAPATIRHIAYRLSSKLYDKNSGGLISTPAVMVTKFQKAFDLWASVAEAGLSFSYGGLYEAGSEVFSAQSPVIWIDMTGAPFSDPGASGGGRYEGTIPDAYRGGLVTLNTKQGLYPLAYGTTVHEIGHTLGLQHAPANSSMMFCGTRSWPERHDALFFAEQDRANLIRLWNPAADSLYTISGRVSGVSGADPAALFAVNVSDGTTYSNETSSDGAFVIPVLKAGSYRLGVKSGDGHMFADPGPFSPRWYVSNTETTADAIGGAVFALSVANRAVGGLVLAVVATAPPSNLHWAYDDGATFARTFMLPGDTGDFWISHMRGSFTNLEAYGSSSGIRFKAGTVVPE